MPGKGAAFGEEKATRHLWGRSGVPHTLKPNAPGCPQPAARAQLAQR
jgi:hypothetical protein